MTPSSNAVPQTNWAGNVIFAAQRSPQPSSVADLQRIVAGSNAVRALGTGHSFNRIADTTGDLVRMDALPRTIEVDAPGRRALLTGGVRFGELGQELARAGLALPNTGSLPHISVAGACATGTHGSGTANQVLGSRVSAMTLVTAEGDLVTVDRDVDEQFDGWVLALGRLGIVVSLTLDLVEDFQVAQTVVEDVTDDVIAEQVQTILAAAYSVSVFTDWRVPARNQVWVKELVGRPDSWDGRTWGGRTATGPLNPVHGMPVENATAQLGVPGPWNERLPHFRMEFTPSSGDELQSEYLLPLRHAATAWRRLERLRESIHPVLQICELRTVAADPMWLSMTGGELSVAFHFTWRPDPDAVRPVLAAIEDALDPLGSRPHWGKVFGTSPATLEERYPRLADFRRLVTRLDPSGKFGNDLVDSWVGLR